MNHKPKLINIILNDFIIMLGIIIFIVGITLYLDTEYLHLLHFISRKVPKLVNSNFFLYYMIGSVALSIPIIRSRIQKIYKLFENGSETIGEIQYIAFYKDRGRIEYKYVTNNVEYSGGMGIMKNSITKKLDIDDKITILFDPTNPNKSIIKDLYI